MPKVKSSKDKWMFVSDRDSFLYSDLAGGMSVQEASNVYHISEGHVYAIRRRLTYIYARNVLARILNDLNPFEDLPNSFEGISRGKPGKFYLV